MHQRKMDDDKFAPAPLVAGQAEADDFLENLGYKPELARNRSTLQVAFMSFVLASIPYGLATTLFYPLIGGGPVNIIWGWVLVSMIIICVAASLGEITSVYPTAGGKFFSFSYLLLRNKCSNGKQAFITRLSCSRLVNGVV